MIVVGGSLGGCEALREILRPLPADYPRPIVVTLHRHKESEGMLVPMIQAGLALKIVEAEDKEPLQPGLVYVCPPDYHLLVDRNCVALSTDDLVNFARPSIDVLFDSAAAWHRGDAIAVVLTGAGSDGSRGAKRVHEAGGTVLVQQPATAEGPWMPGATIAAVPTARVLTLAQIAGALLALAGRR